MPEEFKLGLLHSLLGNQGFQDSFQTNGCLETSRIKIEEKTKHQKGYTPENQRLEPKKMQK